jgi:hypothetical protein
LGWYRLAGRRLRVRTSGLPMAFGDLMMTVSEPGSALSQGLDPGRLYPARGGGVPVAQLTAGHRFGHVSSGVRTVASCTTTIYRPVAVPFQGYVSGVGHGETWYIRFSFPLTTLTGGSAG